MRLQLLWSQIPCACLKLAVLLSRLPDVAGTQPALRGPRRRNVQQFNKAVSALSQAGIRYETTLGSAPYLIRVEESEQFAARPGDPRKGGYLNDAEESTDPWMAPARCSSAKSDTSGPTSAAGKSSSCSWRAWTSSPRQGPGVGRPSTLACRRKNNDRGVSGDNSARPLHPKRRQTQSLVGLIRNGTNADPSRITIVDQHSNSIYDGATSDGRDTLRSLADQGGAASAPAALKRALDQLFGPGLATATVTASFIHVQEESISEELEPAEEAALAPPRTTESTSSSGPSAARRLRGTSRAPPTTESTAAPPRPRPRASAKRGRLRLEEQAHPKRRSPYQLNRSRP